VRTGWVRHGFRNRAEQRLDVAIAKRLAMVL
jgi:hypothetical protein